MLWMRQRPKDLVRGFILSCPLVQPHQESTPSQLVIQIGQFFRAIFPELPLTPANRGRGFTLKEMLEETLSFPLTYTGRLRIGTGFALKDAFEDMFRNLHEISVPFLLQHGTKDTVVDIKGT